LFFWTRGKKKEYPTQSLLCPRGAGLKKKLKLWEFESLFLNFWGVYLFMLFLSFFETLIPFSAFFCVGSHLLSVTHLSSPILPESPWLFSSTFTVFSISISILNLFSFLVIDFFPFLTFYFFFASFVACFFLSFV